MEVSGKDEILATALLYVGCGLKIKNRKKYREKRRACGKEWLKQRSEKGHYNNIVQELRLWDSAGYRRFLIMDSETFEVYYRVSFCLMLKLL